MFRVDPLEIKIHSLTVYTNYPSLIMYEELIVVRRIMRPHYHGKIRYLSVLVIRHIRLMDNETYVV